MMAIAQAFRNSAAHFSQRPTPDAAPRAPQIPDLIPRGKALAQHFLHTLNERLKTSTYIAGERFTIADITGYVSIDFARWIGIEPMAEHEALARWRAGIKARPSARV
jgi:glutathione S-transferase